MSHFTKISSLAYLDTFQKITVGNPFGGKFRVAGQKWKFWNPVFWLVYVHNDLMKCPTSLEYQF